MSEPLRKVNKRTGEVATSTDGGKTWHLDVQPLPGETPGVPKFTEFDAPPAPRGMGDLKTLESQLPKIEVGAGETAAREVGGDIGAGLGDRLRASDRAAHNRETDRLARLGLVDDIPRQKGRGFSPESQQLFDRDDYLREELARREAGRAQNPKTAMAANMGATVAQAVATPAFRGATMAGKALAGLGNIAADTALAGGTAALAAGPGGEAAAARRAMGPAALMSTAFRAPGAATAGVRAGRDALTNALPPEQAQAARVLTDLSPEGAAARAQARAGQRDLDPQVRRITALGSGIEAARDEAAHWARTGGTKDRAIRDAMRREMSGEAVIPPADPGIRGKATGFAPSGGLADEVDVPAEVMAVRGTGRPPRGRRAGKGSASRPTPAQQLAEGVPDEAFDYIRDDASFRKGTREALGNAYRGARTPEEADRIAASMEPIKVTAEVSADGATRWEVVDGRHRLEAARKAGATRMPATLRTFRQGADGWAEDEATDVLMRVPVAEPQPATRAIPPPPGAMGQGRTPLASVSPNASVMTAGGFAERQAQQLEAMLANADDLGPASRQAIRNLHQLARSTQDKITDAIGRSGDEGADALADAHHALDLYKQRLGQMSSNLKGGADNRLTQQALRQMYEDARQHLEDASVWGQAAAGRQQRVNKAWTEDITQRDRYENTMLTSDSAKRGADPFEDLLEADPRKVQGILSNAGRATNDLSERSMREGLGSTRRLVDALTTEYNAPPELRQKAQQLGSQIDDLLAEFEGVKQNLSRARELRDIKGADVPFSKTVAGGVNALGAVEEAVRNSGIGRAATGVVARLAGYGGKIAEPARKAAALTTGSNAAARTNAQGANVALDDEKYGPLLQSKNGKDREATYTLLLTQDPQFRARVRAKAAQAEGETR